VRCPRVHTWAPGPMSKGGEKKGARVLVFRGKEVPPAPYVARILRRFELFFKYRKKDQEVTISSCGKEKRRKLSIPPEELRP